ncbi:MAG TPA: hypothetical protein VFF80_04615 [Bacillota bacterium]|nr:hypothetical protein [Bacillota bacterium]
MNNQYINGMNEIKADDELKKTIINRVKQNNAKRLSQYFPRRKVISVVAVACLVISVIIFGIPFVQNRSNRAENAFIITAYAADGTTFKLNPAVDFLLGKYQVTMSSVPGFPLKVLCVAADAIKLTVTDGEFLLWSSSDWKVRNQGKELQIESGETVYWTPLQGSNTDTLARNCTISLKAYKNNQELGSTTIKIESDDRFTYTGRLSK